MNMILRVSFFLVLMIFPTMGAMRTWTSASGATVEAEYVRSDDRAVVLMNAEGRMFQIGMSSLSHEDQTYIRAQQIPSPEPKPDPKESFLLTDEQIAQLKTELEVKPGERLVFTGSFRPRRLDAREQRRLRPDSPVPYQITADFFEARQVRDGRWSRRRIGTRVEFYLQDARGQVLVHRSDPVASLCPT